VAQTKAQQKAYRKKWYQKNKARIIAKAVAWGRAHPEIVRNRNRLKRWREYGISLTETGYALLLEQQSGCCAICNQPPTKTRLHVDHDHLTGIVRGLLCYSCNRLAVHIEHVRAALRYLEAHEKSCI
jgi:recombination endonuclease VII